MEYAGRLGWDFRSIAVQTKYKKGLPRWIQPKLTTASGMMAILQQEMDVEKLSQVALNEEANRDIADAILKNQHTDKVNTKKADGCNYCHKLGHTETECRTKLSQQKRVKYESQV